MPMARVSCNLVLVHVRRHCVDGLPLYEHTRGTKIDSGSKINKPDSDDELDLTLINEELRVQHGQILTELSDSLLEAPLSSSGIVGETERLEDLTLGSDEEQVCSSVPVPSQPKESDLPTCTLTHCQSSTESEAEKTLVRQEAVVSDEDAAGSATRTKKDVAIWGVRRAVASLNKMAARDPTQLDKQDRLIIKKNRKNIRKFERTYGLIGEILGLDYPAGFRGEVDEGLQSTPQGTESSSTLETKVDGNEGVQLVKPDKPVASLVNTSCTSSTVAKRVCSGSECKPGGSKPVTTGEAKKGAAATQPKLDKELPAPSKANSLRVPHKGKSKGDSAGKEQVSKSTHVDHLTGGNRKDKTVVKRARSGDDQQIPMAKKASQTSGGSHKDSGKGVKRAQSEDDKPSTSKKVKDASQSDTIQAAIIDRKDPDGRISTEMWRQLEDRLMDEIFQARGRPQEIAFKGADWYKGVKTVGCGNKETFEFLKAAIGRSGDLCPNAQLEVILAAELPLRPIVTVWIPPPVKSVEVILGILEGQNSGLSTSQWKFISKAEGGENQGRDFRFAVNPESLTRLDSVGGVVTFGLGYVKFRYSKNDKAKEADSGADKSASL